MSATYDGPVGVNPTVHVHGTHARVGVLSTHTLYFVVTSFVEGQERVSTVVGSLGVKAVLLGIHLI